MMCRALFLLGVGSRRQDSGRWLTRARGVPEALVAPARIGSACAIADREPCPADDATRGKRPRDDDIGTRPQRMPSEAKAIDAAMGAHPEAADESALGRDLVHGELDQRWPAHDDDEPFTSETEPGGLFPARLGPRSLTRLAVAPADPRRPGVVARLGWRRLRLGDGWDPRRRRERPRRDRQGRRRHRGRRDGWHGHRRYRDDWEGHGRKRDRRRRKGRQCSGGSGPAARQCDDHQGAPRDAAPQHGLHPEHVCVQMPAGDSFLRFAERRPGPRQRRAEAPGRLHPP